ncbi:MAG: hypothetical protein AB1498_07155 [bacterium]
MKKILLIVFLFVLIHPLKVKSFDFLDSGQEKAATHSQITANVKSKEKTYTKEVLYYKNDKFELQEDTSAVQTTGRDPAASSTLDAVKTAMEMYAADNGTYPINISDVNALVKTLESESVWPTNIKTDGSYGSLIAAATNPEGVQFKLYAIGQDENHCYGLAQDGRKAGPGTLSDITRILGAPFPGNVQGSQNNTAIQSDAKKIKYKDINIGVFKTSLTSDELKGYSPNSLVVTFEGDNLFAVYGVSGRNKTPGETKIYMQPTESQEYKSKLEEMQNKQKTVKELETKGIILLNEYNSLKNSSEEKKKKYEKQMKDNDVLYNNAIVEYEKLQNELNQLRFKQPVAAATVKPQIESINRSVIHNIYGRFKKQGKAVLNINNQTTGENILKIEFELPETPGGDKIILNEWAKAQEVNLTRIGNSTPGDSVFPYITRQTSKRLNVPGQSITQPGTFGRNREQTPDLYSVTTGALAIQESLQLDRMTAAAEGKYKDEVPVENLAGPKIKSHPFEEMLNNRSPKILPIVSLVPEEFYYFHFSDINKEIEFSDLLDQWGSSLLNTMQVSSHDAGLKEKYLTQLCVKISVLTRLFGDKVIDDLAIVGNDPFIHEGTDISIIFTVKNKTLFDAQMSGYFADAKEKFKDLKETDIPYGQYAVHSLTTGDKTVSSFSCYLGDFKVYSNSKAALEKIIDTYDKKHPSLADAKDFLYMRTIFPEDKSQEDAFLYLPETFIRKLVGPKWKIARQRRIRCNTTLRMINNVITMYYMEKNTEPPVLEKLLEEYYLGPGYLVCPDGGSYSINPKTMEPSCSVHGRLRYLTPIAEMPLTLVSKKEQAEYERFVNQYNSYWSGFFDPVGIRAKFDDKTIKVETCILPLIENSIYNDFKDFAGGDPVSISLPTAPGTILQFLLKINLKEKGTDRFTQELVGKTSFTIEEFMKILGDNLSINFMDNEMMFSLDLSKGGPLFGGLGRRGFEVMPISFALSSLNLPTYMTISVKDEKEAQRFIDELINSFTQENRARKNEWISVNNYEVAPEYKGHKIETLDLDLLIVNLRLHFMVYKNHLIIANQLDVLTKLIDNPKDVTKAETNVLLNIRGDSFNKIADTVKLGWQERMRQVCLNNLGSIYVLHKYRNVPFDKINDASMLVNGYFPFCPSNGEHKYDKNRDAVYCTVHGDLISPKQPFGFDLNVQLNKFVNSINRTETSLKFTPEGIMTSVVIEKGGK